MAKPKVVLSYLVYPLAMGTYFRRALQRLAGLGAIDLTVIGSYSGTKIPWCGGMDLPKKYDIPPDIPLPYPPSGPYDPTAVEAALGFEPDLWLQVDAGYQASRRPKAKVVAHVATDPHVLNYDLPRSYADKFFCMQTPQMKDGDYWLPYACDPDWHAPFGDRVVTLDSCIIGLQYPQRVKLVDALRAKGFNIRMETGLMGSEYREVYSHARVGLHWSSLNDLAARVFELMGMGLCPVINRVPDLTPLFEENVHYLGFSTLEEAIEKFTEAVKNEPLRNKIARMASDQVHFAHTWDIRVNQLLEVCGYA